MPTNYDGWGDAVTAVPAQVIAQEELDRIYMRLDAVEYENRYAVNRYAMDGNVIHKDELYHILNNFRSELFAELADRIHLLGTPDITLIFDKEE